MIVLITGGNGLIGTAISKYLLEAQHEVRYLSRKEDLTGQIKKFKWDIDSGTIDKRAFEGVDAIIHLAGAGIADARWTSLRKKEILDSRVKTSGLLLSYIEAMTVKPKVFAGGSAIGFYGAVTSDKIFDESDKATSDFLGETCKIWEASYVPIQKLGIRTAVVRTGIVLSKTGGALPKMAGPAKWGIGSPLADGKQYIPWIHENDIARIFVHCLENSTIEGTFNGVGSEHINNKDLTRLVCKVLKRPFFFPAVPSFILKLLFGEMADAFLKGSRISNTKIKATGFKFQFEDAEAALVDLLRK
jgi:uncharacterized protein